MSKKISARPTKMIRELEPIPGVPADQLLAMSRQQRYKLRRYAAGLCTSCGKAPRAERSRSLCPECLSDQRERVRARTGAGRRNYRASSYAAPAPSAPAPVAPRGSATSAPRPKKAAKPAASATARGPRADEPSRRRR